MSFIDPNQFAKEIIISDQEENLYLDFTNPTVHNSPYPFLRRATFLIPHKEAMRIINGLRAFYEMHTEKDIKDINDELADIIGDL